MIKDNLSDKIFHNGYDGERNVLWAKDVKEFIRKLKEEMRINPMSIAIIDNLAGSHLIDSPYLEHSKKTDLDELNASSEDNEPEDRLRELDAHKATSGSNDIIDDVCENCGRTSWLHKFPASNNKYGCEQFKKEQGT